MALYFQEPKSDKDEEYSKKVNEYLNNPPTPGSNRGGEGSLPSDLANLGRGVWAFSKVQFNYNRIQGFQ
ncbi:hypothetical protein DPMN_158340 [Dreissena polymorpha]|uniref:Uncharacterized protein n=1 Tax=Dreissena polymorpha TaxID=45954 RepID=A0A9D4EJN7_DREPO|nr:hypothetical protein DPMN_158340 [Dreissena polymorpha]